MVKSAQEVGFTKAGKGLSTKFCGEIPGGWPDFYAFHNCPVEKRGFCGKARFSTIEKVDDGKIRKFDGWVWLPIYHR